MQRTTTNVKITFGMILFNAESILPKNMLKLCIENVYKYAHEIIIIEGATKSINHCWDGNTTLFTKDGKSTDNTLEVVKNIYDPFHKIKLIESNGFWDGKTSMCNEYSSISTGDYIWQLDSDEFYKTEDIEKILLVLEDLKPDAVHFFANHFYGDFHHCIDEREDGHWGNDIPWKRIFKNVPKKSFWKSHEPPDYVCDNKVCNEGYVIDKYQTLNLNLKMFHYSYVVRSQAVFKDIFFNQNFNTNEWDSFQENKNSTAHGSKVFEFKGEHPKIIKDNYNL